MTSPTGAGRPPFGPTLALDYPLSLGVFEQYAEAQAAVDYLADHDFPVDQCLIVGTELKQLERVTGRLTYGRVAAAGAASGIWLGLFVGLVFALFAGPRDTLVTVLWSVLFGAFFGLVWGLIGYAMTRGRRDFTSVSQVIATRYEVLTEHKHAQQGRDLLAERGPLPGGLDPRD